MSIFHNNIIQVLQLAVEDCVPNIKSHCSQQIPGWNEYVKVSHSIARDAFNLWLIIGKPCQGAIYNHMKFSCSRFKYAVHCIKKNEKKTKLINLLMNSVNNIMCHSGNWLRS